METLSYIFFALLGLIIGSFGHVVSLRIPRGESIVTPRSRCPLCLSTLRIRELIPIASYLILAGRCRHCQNKIPLSYPVIEIITAILFVLAFWQLGWTFELLVALPLFSILIIVTHIDIRSKIIPNKITYPGMAYFGIVRFFYHHEQWLDYILGFFIAGGLLFLIAVISRGGMGGGDIKLMAMAGLAIGWKWALLGFFIATFLGGAVSLVLLLSKKAERKDKIAFGPFLAIGIGVAYLWGEPIWQSYWSF